MMMMIGDHIPTVHVPPPWDHEDPAADIHFPLSLAALQRYLPSNRDDDVAADGYDADDFDNFRMFEFKVKRCARARSHDWTECPYAHPGEKARRRDPRKYHYSGSACPDFRRGACRKGDACEHAHGVFECWLHPARYRTQPCKDGTHCRRRVCFFAHTPEQLRVLPYTSSPDESPRGLGHDSFDSLRGLGHDSFESPRGLGHDSFAKSAVYSPPATPPTGSPPVSPGGSVLSSLTESMRGLQRPQINKMKIGMGMSLSVSPPGWGPGTLSPRSPSFRPGFMSLPSTPIRSVTRSGLGAFDAWETPCEEEPAMERVESGRALRERIYAKLGRENSLDRVGRRGDSAGAVPDVGWVSELVN